MSDSCLGDGPCSVLVVPGYLQRIPQSFIATLPSDWQRKYKLFFIGKQDITQKNNEENENYFKLVAEKCLQILKENDINVIFADRDMANLIKVCVAKGQANFKGPSIQSVAKLMHSYYITTVIDSSPCQLPNMVIDLDCDIYESCRDILFNIGLPCHARTAFACENPLIVSVSTNKDALIRQLATLKVESLILAESRKAFYEDIPELKELPLFTKPVAVYSKDVSRFTVPKSSSFENIYIEAALHNGEVIPWAICDFVTIPHGSNQPVKYFFGQEMPTKLSQTKQDLLWERFGSDLDQVKGQGFDNSFVHGEYMVFTDGTIELFHMSGFPHTNCVHMYNLALNGGNNIDAALQLGNGVKPEAPTLNGSYALTHLLMVFTSGKAQHLINFNMAANFNSALTLRYKSEDDIIIEPPQQFAVIGVIAVKGSNFDECVRQIGAIRNAVIKIPELVPFASS